MRVRKGPHLALVLGWTAPYGISCARMRSSKISNRGAARGEAYSHRHGYVKERFSIAWGRLGRAADIAAKVEAPPSSSVLQRSSASASCAGGLWSVSLLDAKAARARARGGTDSAP